MILFYSDTCQHCSVLLDTIKRYDNKKTIKLVCIDTKINIVKEIIKNVPALMFLPSKEIIYGKKVFDYLIMPDRGYLFTSKSGRNNKEDLSSLSSPIPLNNEKTDEPEAFTLGSILTDNFSNIDDDDMINKNKIYKWDFIENDNRNINIEREFKEKLNEKTNKNLPSIEELTRDRENLFKDIK